MTRYVLLLLLAACSGPGQRLPDAGDAGAPEQDPPDAGVHPWNAWLGAHYSNRAWAAGGLREPGGAHGYQPSIDGGVITDLGITGFRERALPLVDEVLAQGGSVVLLVGGAQDEGFFPSMRSPAGRAAFKQALRARVSAIHDLGRPGWERRVVFQFGNEIQNPERFYGAVCRGGGASSDQCDLAAEFAPAYVDWYLAPGAETLREESLRLFGRNDALRVALGSVVNLTTRRAFIDTLLGRTVAGDAAPSLVGRQAASFVDTVTIHYTMPSPEATAALDSFADRWLSPDAGAVTALWMTEEVGVNAAKAGDGLAAALRAYAPAMSWWAKRQLSPEQAHLFIWGADVRCSTDGGATCQSVDQAMPLLASFLGAAPLVETRVDPTPSMGLVTSAWSAGPSKFLVLAWAPARATSTVTSLVLPDVGSLGSARAYLVGSDPKELPVMVRGNELLLTAQLSDRDVVMVLVEP